MRFKGVELFYLIILLYKLLSLFYNCAVTILICEGVVVGYKEVLSGISIVITIMAFLPYIKSIIEGGTKPHVFSWVIWSSTTFIIFLAQLSDKGGAGAWPLGVSSIISLYVAFLAYKKKSDITITRSDWIFFLIAMGSLPLWYFTSDPLLVVIILTSVDVMGFGPTYRKAYRDPYSEKLQFFTLMGVREFFSVSALENYSLTTLLFPVAMSSATWIFIVMVLIRRRKVHT